MGTWLYASFFPACGEKLDPAGIFVPLPDLGISFHPDITELTLFEDGFLFPDLINSKEVTKNMADTIIKKQF